MPELPRLSDGVITLRPPTDADVPEMVVQSIDPETQRWTTVPREYTEASAAEFLTEARHEAAKPAGNRLWAIERRTGGRELFAGLVDARWKTPLTAEIGYALHPAHRGEGVMSDALRLLARHCFTDGPWGVPLRRVHWKAEVGNWGSRRVAWACGFTFHGTLPDELRHWNNDGTTAVRDAWTASLGAEDVMEPVHPWLEPQPLLIRTAAGEELRLRAWRDDDTPWQQPDESTGQPAAHPAHWMPVRAILAEPMFPTWLMGRREQMALGRTIEWCIADARTDRALGSISIFSRGGVIADSAELGYQLVSHARGRGIGSAAARAVVHHVRDDASATGLERPLRRLTAQTAADNAASNGVLSNCGFEVYGREPAVDELPDGSFADALHWHLLLR